jgi:hypothetical protein
MARKLSKAKQLERTEAIARLREFLKPGDTVYTIVHHVARSGMSRDIALIKLVDGEPRYLSHNAAIACGNRLVNAHGHDAIRIGGCGMDMCFALVYELASVIFADVPVSESPLKASKHGPDVGERGYWLTYRDL